MEQLDLIQEMDLAGDFTIAIAVTCWTLAGIHFVYMVVNTICLCKTKYRVTNCFRNNNIVYSSIFLATSLVVWVMQCVAMIVDVNTAKTLGDWKDFSPCLDSFMSITDYQGEQLDRVYSIAIAEFVLLTLVLIICTVNFVV